MPDGLMTTDLAKSFGATVALAGPVLLPGLATGALFAKTRTLHAGILAHNGVAIMAPLLVGRP
jgi:hypothetical protein